VASLLKLLLFFEEGCRRREDPPDGRRSFVVQLPVLPVKTLLPPIIADIVTLLLVLIFYLATVTDNVALIVNDSQNKPSL
jgi:hypothetical protein